MRTRTRKLLGASLLVIALPVYSLVVIGAAGAMLANASTLALTAFFLVTGLIWVLPAMTLVSWMARGDRPPGASSGNSYSNGATPVRTAVVVRPSLRPAAWSTPPREPQEHPAGASPPPPAPP